MTNLSQKAMTIKIGMTQEEVFNILGKPTWLVTQENGIPELISEIMSKRFLWKNGNRHEPVAISFDDTNVVNGVNAGLWSGIFKMPDKYLYEG